MKRRDLLADLTSNGCSLLREGGRHSWWHNAILNKRIAVLRHSEVNNHLARKICRVCGRLDSGSVQHGLSGAGYVDALPCILDGAD